MNGERDKVIVNAYLNGLGTAAEIASAHGLTHQRVWQIVERAAPLDERRRAVGLNRSAAAQRRMSDPELRAKLRAARRALSPWTEAADSTLRAMAKEGKSFGDVAKALGCTRNMIAGRAYRLGASFGSER